MNKEKENGTEQGAEVKKTPYAELMYQYKRARTPKDVRIIHKRLKKYYGQGIPFFERYPNLPLLISVITLLIVIANAIRVEMT